MLIKIKNLLLYSLDSKKSDWAQSVLEYAILVGVVSAALIAMSLYVRRGIQANLKTMEYQVNLEAQTTDNPGWIGGSTTTPTTPTEPESDCGDGYCQIPLEDCFSCPIDCVWCAEPI